MKIHPVNSLSNNKEQVKVELEVKVDKVQQEEQTDNISAFLTFGFDNYYQCNIEILGQYILK